MPKLKIDTSLADKTTIKDIVYTYVYEFMGPLPEKDKDIVFEKILGIINVAQTKPTYDVRADPDVQLKVVEIDKESLFSILIKLVNEYFAGENEVILEMWAYGLLKAINTFLITLDKDGGTK